MENRIGSHLSKLTSYTDGLYKNIQRMYIPSIYDLHVERMYHGDPDITPLGFVKESAGFVSNNLPILYHKRDQVFYGTLAKLVQDRFVQPMLLFYQGRYIKWSDVAIKCTHRYDYLFIKGIDVDAFRGNDDIQCIILPYIGTVYRESISMREINSIGSNESKLFIFDKNGEYVRTPNDKDLYTVITNVKNTNDFYIERYESHPGHVFKSLVVPEDKYICDQNVIYFINSKLPDHAIKKNDFSKAGYNRFTISGNPTDELDMKVFFYNKGNISKNIMNHIKNNNQNRDLYRYDKDFNFSFDIHKSYKENYMNALKYCVTYNSFLLDDVYKEMSNIKSVNYTGHYLKSLADDLGYVKMSTRVDFENYNKVIIYHNGNLYKHYHTIDYINKDFKFYCDDIEDDDILEFVYFKKSYNMEKEIILNSNSDDVYYIGTDIDMDDVKIYSTNLYKDHKFFNIEVSELAQYAIPFKYKLVNKTDRMYKIYPEHPFYYDKKCTLVSNRQFRYYHKKVQVDNCINFELPADFKFCSDINRYMIYINGRKINHSNFKITIVKNTRPFYSPSVYMNIPTSKDDVIDVFYVPDVLNEISVDKDLNPTNGVIFVDKSKLSYNLDKDLYLFFINGKKVNPNDIVNISKNVIMITKADSIHNVSIIKHINSIDVLHKLFAYTDDIMENIINDISDLDINDKLTKFYGESHIGSEKPFDDNAIEMKNVLYKLIRDYWNKPYVTDGNEFIYDFDTEGLDLDQDGNIIVPTMNASVKY